MRIVFLSARMLLIVQFAQHFVKVSKFPNKVIVPRIHLESFFDICKNNAKATQQKAHCVVASPFKNFISNYFADKSVKVLNFLVKIVKKIKKLTLAITTCNVDVFQLCNLLVYVS